MASRPKKYKQYLNTDDSPPKSTKYDHAAKKRQLSSSSSSTDDMQAFYSIIDQKIKLSKCNVQETYEDKNSGSDYMSAQLTDHEPIQAATTVQSNSNSSEQDMMGNASDDLYDSDESFLCMDDRLGESTIQDASTNTILNNCPAYELDESEEEMEFWKAMEEGKYSVLGNRLASGELDKVVNAKVVVSQAEMLCGVENLCSHFSLPMLAFEYMCKLFNSFLSSPVLPDTRYTIDQLLRSNDIANFHGVCPTCLKYLGTFRNTERTVFCENCQKNVSVKGNNNNFFVIFDTSQKVKKLIEDNEQYYKAVISGHNQQKRCLEDIYDGFKYREFLNSLDDAWKNSYATLTFNSDGSPVWKSSNHSVWPIQMMINELPADVRFNNTLIAALWFGKSKPDMNIFMKTFAKNINTVNKNGITCNIDGQSRTIRLYPLCCCVDSTARAPIQGIIQFNGYYGCNWCHHPGVPVMHKKKKVIKYPLLDFIPEKRPLVDTLELMRKLLQGMTCKDAFGIKRVCALVHLLYFDIIDGFVPDEMHCVYLGICRQFARMWFDTFGLPYSLKHKISKIDEILSKIQTPKQLTRLSRLLSERKHWKALEWQNWLLFYSLPILRSMPNFKVYEEHWQLLVEAMHILKSSSISEQDLARVDKCLKQFVADTEKLYGQTAMTFNVHQLLHLSESVKNWGPVSFHNGYPFESGNGKILKMIKSTNGVIHQICRKLEYRNSALLLEKHISENDEDSPVIKFINHQLKNDHTEKSIKVENRRYFGKSVYTDVKWINLRNLNENFTKSYEKMLKDNCIFACHKKEEVRSNSSYALNKNGSFVRIITFVVDKVNKKEYTICNYIETENCFDECLKLKKIVKIHANEIDIDTADIDKVAVLINTQSDRYIAAVPNLLQS